MKKKILFLGDGIYTKNLLKLYSATLFDKYLIDYKLLNSQNKKFKKKFKINLIDKKKILSLTKKFKINFVITNQNDFAIPTYGYLCTKLGLSGIPYAVCNRFANKKKCREYLKNIRSCKKFIPHFYFNSNKIPKSQRNKKLIIKPINMQGSRYVEKISFYQLKQKIKNLNKVNIKYIIEEYIKGQDYAVESVIINKKIHNLVISKKIKFPNSFIDRKIISKNFIENKIENKIYKINKLILKNLKLENGLTHLEFRSDYKGNIFLIEAACRGAGSGISNIIVPYLTGFDTDEFLFEMSLGKKFTWKDCHTKKRKTILIWLNKNEKFLLKNKNNLLFYKKKRILSKIVNSEDRGSFFIKKVL